MATLKIAILLYYIIGAACFVVVTTAYAQTQVSLSVSCMMAYDEGGAPAVFDSQECTQWALFPRNRTFNCQYASLQGRREYQEDRIACDLHLTIPLLIGNSGPKEVNVGLLAVFDGHGGSEASEMASQCLIDYFCLHSVFIMYKKMMIQKNEETTVLLNRKDDYEMGSVQLDLTLERTDTALPALNDQLMHLEILEDALVKTIHDIDSRFSQKAYQNKLNSGSTAVVVVIVDGKILVANVGDSKAFMCSAETQSGNAVSHLVAKELTKDHHPDRDDERARIEAAGGSVIVWGVPRVNGILSVSRAIGDVYLKRYGLISVPELVGWKSLSTTDKYLALASDGIFEILAPQDVCDVILSSCSSSSTLAECIVATAYVGGSTDNLSAVVVPLSLMDGSENHIQ